MRHLKKIQNFKINENENKTKKVKEDVKQKAYEIVVKILDQRDLIETQRMNFQPDLAYDIVNELINLGIIK